MFENYFVQKLCINLHFANRCIIFVASMTLNKFTIMNKEDFIKELKELVLSEKTSKKSTETKIGMFLNKFNCLIAETDDDLKDLEYYPIAIRFIKSGFAEFYAEDGERYLLSFDSINMVNPEKWCDNEYSRECEIFLKSGQKIVIKGNRNIVPLLTFLNR